MHTRLTEADEIIDALKDHARGHYLGKALPQLEESQSEGGGSVLLNWIKEKKECLPRI